MSPGWMRNLLLGVLLLALGAFGGAWYARTQLPEPRLQPDPQAEPEGPEQAERNRHEEELHEHADVPEPYASMRNPLRADEATLAAGREIYAENCASCHGQRGEGDGPAGSGLEPRPADFTDRRMMDESTDAYLFWRISEGVPGTGMPAWQESLSETQRWQVLTFIREEFAHGTGDHAH